MAQYEGSRQQPTGSELENLSAWGLGFILFGSVLLVLLGSFHFMVGIAALLDDSFVPVREGFALDLDTTAWGWLHLVGGVLIMGIGASLIGGSTISRLSAIAVTALSALWNFYSIPYYPIWSVIMLLLCLAVLWALIVHGSDFTKIMTEQEDVDATRGPV